MHYLSFHLMPPAAFEQAPDPAMYERMGALIEEMTAAGALIAAGGSLGPSGAIRYAYQGGRLTITDGPFAEAKEVIGGFAIINADSREALVEWTRRFAEVLGEVHGEVHQLSGPAMVFSHEP